MVFFHCCHRIRIPAGMSKKFGFSQRHIHNRKYVSRMFQNFGKIQPTSTDMSCISQKLMIYNEVIQSCHSGTYHLLPLGLRALEKLIKIIDQEMQSIGGQKISMPTLASSVLWKKSGRWKDAGPELFKLKDRHLIEYCLGPTHEELVTKLFSSVSPISYKRLPMLLYQITRKFRDEMSPKHGLLRGREFEMKDMYTFDSSEANAMETYSKVCSAYCRIFERLNVNYVKAAGATGNIGGSLSHEFHLLSDVGEDTLVTCSRCGYSSNVELIENYNGNCVNNHCPSQETVCDMEESTGIEVGHTFLLGHKYSSVFHAMCRTEAGKHELLHMGCYGLGVTRILQGCLEVLSSENKLCWPSLIAPYQICIMPQKEGYEADTMFRVAEKLSDKLSSLPNLVGEVVIDDRTKMTIGKRIYEGERLGYPYIIIVGKKAVEPVPLFEVIDTAGTNQSKFLSTEQLLQFMSLIKTISLS